MKEFEAENCSLSCQNGGYCTFMSDPNDEAKIVRETHSGKMVQRCVCPPGYGGMGCEIEVEQCNTDTNTCNAGVPCVTDPLTLVKKCDCEWADRVSDFAGRMCRKPFTEYCGGNYSVKQALAFCTNGGKCKSSYLSAHYDPREEQINQSFEHLGCICNKSFYGPHCEFLKYDGQPPYHPHPGEFKESEPVTPHQPKPVEIHDVFENPVKATLVHEDGSFDHRSIGPMITGLSISMVAFLVMGTTWLVRRRRRRQKGGVWMNPCQSPTQNDNIGGFNNNAFILPGHEMEERVC